MAAPGARAVGAGDGAGRRTGMTPAQIYCLAIGATLLLVGLLGFIADATFDTGASGRDNDGGNVGGALQGDSFLGFEVNGWHNVVHILSGVFLLASFRLRGSAKKAALAMALAFGLGGRDVANRMLQDAYSSGQERKEDAKPDFRQGKEKAKEDAQQLKDKAQEREPATVGSQTSVRVSPSDGSGRFTPGSAH
jgi:hypothetical protein